MARERVNWIPEEAQIAIDHFGDLITQIKQKAGSWDHFTPEFVGTKVQSFNLAKAREDMTSAQARYQEGRISQNEGLVKFETELPVSVFFVGDVHFGSIYTEHERFMADLQRIVDTPNAYIVFMSNLIDNAIPAKFPANMLANSMPPDKQVVAMRQIVQELDRKGKVLGAVTSDCHEGWTYAQTGQDINALIFGYEGRNFPVLENGGRLTLQFPQTEYTLGLYHKIGPFRSNFNYTHGLKQMNRLKQNGECDLTAGAHYHCGAVEEVWEGTGDQMRLNLYVQSGTYKGTGELHDQWSQSKFGATGQPGAQHAIFWPKERRLAGHTDFETGILCHESVYVMEMVKTDP